MNQMSKITFEISDGRTVILTPDPTIPGYYVPTMVSEDGGRRTAICAGREPVAALDEARRIANAVELDLRWTGR